MSLHFNGLTPAEAERLALLLEELGEAQQAIGKILRHGYDSRHPDGGPTNRQQLEQEIADVHVSGEILIHAGDVAESNIWRYADKKREKLPRYLHHNSVGAADTGREK